MSLVAESSPRTEQDTPYPHFCVWALKLAGEGLALAANPQTFVVSCMATAMLARTLWLNMRALNKYQKLVLMIK